MYNSKLTYNIVLEFIYHFLTEFVHLENVNVLLSLGDTMVRPSALCLVGRQLDSDPG